jgi:FkbM family methyltransferase
LGYLVEKYTDAYFLKKDENGAVVPYGVEGIEGFEQGILREHDSEILRHVDFKGASVLEFGFGRGESIKFGWEHGATAYTAVDFSESACRIAGDFLRKFSIEGPRIVCSDALEFLRGHVDSGAAETAKFDLVLMLDFVEHVPRSEFAEILRLLKRCVRDTSVIVVNTPDFKVDNDVIAEGLNEQGRDSSDGIAETRGMHCNRYTLDSLRRFFLGLGYAAVSRGHYFVPALPGEQDVYQGVRSYAGAWADARARGARLLGPWPRESFETAYEVAERPQLQTFTVGNLSGLSLYVTRSYLQYYGGGNYDAYLFEFISRADLAGKTIYDLGSFVGVNTLQFARLVGPQGVVCAFEPNPMNADRLRLNLSENPELEARVRVFPLALSNEIGSVRFSLHRDVDAGVSSASYIQGAHTTLSEETLTDLGFVEVDVQVCTIDEFRRRTGHVPSLIKIDIEGSEHLALLGGIETLREAHPLLLIELHSIYCAVVVLNTIETLGYATELLHIEEDGRCFIGASVRTASTGEPRIREPQGASLQTEVFRHELERVRATLQTMNRREAESRQQVVAMKGEVGQLQGNVEQLQAALTQTQVERGQLQGELGQLQEVNGRLHGDLAQLHADIGRLQTEAGQLNIDRARLQEELESERARLGAEISALRAESAAIDAQRAAYESALADCTGERNAAWARIADLESELQAHRAQVASLHEALEKYRHLPLFGVARKVRRLFVR